MKLHLGNCNEHPEANDPTISCWAIRDESGRKVGPDELLAHIAELEGAVDSINEILIRTQSTRTDYREALDSLRSNLCAMTQTPIIESWIGIIDAATKR